MQAVRQVDAKPLRAHVQQLECPLVIPKGTIHERIQLEKGPVTVILGWHARCYCFFLLFSRFLFNPRLPDASCQCIAIARDVRLNLIRRQAGDVVGL